MAPGDVLRGRYRIDARLGEGGMGEVWRGTDLQLGREVAVKVLLPSMLAREDALARFEREARVGAALAHGNVVHTLDFGVERGRWFLVMQLVSGGSLLEYRLAHQPLGAAQILDFGYQIADALAAAHAIGLVHRDLKPENVLVEAGGGPAELRVADFGMAFVVAPDDPRQGRLTMEGALGGTPEYMAPELAQGVAASPASDVYALGCLVYELACGATPFEDPGVGKIIAGHLYAQPPHVRALRPDLPAGLDELVQRMLAKHPAERPTAEAAQKRFAMLDPSGRHGTGVVSDRSMRMITAAPPVGDVEVADIDARVAVIGVLDRDCLIALAAAGLSPVGPGAERPDARIVVSGTLDQIALAVEGGAPVVADAARNDFHRISQLLRIGVAEVVFTPIDPPAIVRKLLRALKKRPAEDMP